MASPPPRPTIESRRSRGFSFKSEKSHKSTGSGTRISLQETPEEKARRTLHTKADPTVAMNELQPMAVALMEKSNLGSLRTIQHKDQFGNPITEPDLSNPTRPRFERPLDTIRSFEAAVNSTYTTRPQSYLRNDDASQAGDHSRRASYYGGDSPKRNEYNPTNGFSRRYTDQSAYYGGRQSRPDSFVESYGAPNPANDNYYPYNQGNGRSRPRQSQRMHSESAGYALNGPQPGYPQQNGYHRSYDNETPASGSGSYNTEPWGNATDPSSLNSSADQLQQHQHQPQPPPHQQQQQQQRYEDKVAENYGFQGFGPGPNINDSGAGMSGSGQDWAANNGSSARNGYGIGPQRRPGQLMGDPNVGGPVGGRSLPPLPAANRGQLRKQPSVSQNNEKRKSWFKRTFSKD